jgi:hypothetical protein
MRRQAVVSSTLSSVGYDAKSQTLEIEFHGGSVYQYSGVPRFVFSALIAQESLGAYFNAQIRDVYEHTRIR